jgi:hypothetical protein
MGDLASLVLDLCSKVILGCRCLGLALTVGPHSGESWKLCLGAGRIPHSFVNMSSLQ